LRALVFSGELILEKNVFVLSAPGFEDDVDVPVLIHIARNGFMTMLLSNKVFLPCQSAETGHSLSLLFPDVTAKSSVLRQGPPAGEDIQIAIVIEIRNGERVEILMIARFFNKVSLPVASAVVFEPSDPSVGMIRLRLNHIRITVTIEIANPRLNS